MIYHDSNTNSERLTSPDQIKWGRKRTLTAEQEFFGGSGKLKMWFTRGRFSS